jgi:hypothetical protein
MAQPHRKGNVMPAAEATVRTEYPGRYLVQLCKHASKMDGHLRPRPRAHGGGAAAPEIRSAEWTSTDGIVTLNWGQWTMRAAPGTLTLRAEADSQENLRRIQDFVAARLEKIGGRDHLTVNWQLPDPPSIRDEARG